jgi:flagellar hook-associated protein 3 FlgL
VRVGAFEAFNDFVDALEGNDLEAITRGITEITKVRETVDLAIARIGSRRSVLEGQSQVNEETGIQLKKLLSDVKDLDYAEKVTEMQSQMTLLQAAQASFAKISQLSVWNYLK